MTRLPRLAHAVEYLDAPVQEREELEGSLDDVAAVNRWLGGERALLGHLGKLISPANRFRFARPLTILDAGTGSGDLPRAIVRWARRRRIPIRVVASDIQDQILEIARDRSTEFPEIDFARADVRQLPFDNRAFDIALLSLTLHHLDGDEPVQALRELRRVSRRGVIVGELERGWPGYIGARILAATIWRNNRLTRHDGPLSVRRAFTACELSALASAAALPSSHVHRHPLFRLVLVAKITSG
jgi:SAM-dependent methyltransferase